jgi:hypothetical protein
MGGEHQVETGGKQATAASGNDQAPSPGRAPLQQDTASATSAMSPLESARASLADARGHALQLEDALALGDLARIELYSGMLAQVMQRASVTIRQLPPDQKSQIAPAFHALRVAILPLLDNAASQPTPGYDAERFVSILGHTNKPPSDELRSGKPASPGLTIQSEGPFKSERVLEIRPNGSRKVLVEEGRVQDGMRVVEISYEAVIDASGRMIGTRDPRVPPPPASVGQQIKNGVGRVWHVIEKAFGSDDHSPDQSTNGFTGTRA